MSYLVINGADLGRRLRSPMGAITGTTVLADGTTPGSRELIIAALSQQVFDWKQQIQGAIDGRFSWADIIFRFPGNGLANAQINASMRASLQRASAALSEQFLPMVSAALRDYDRDSREVIAIATDYLAGTAAALGAALSAEENTRFKAIMHAARDHGVKTVRDALEAGKEAVDEMLPWWAYVAIGLVGCATVAYTIRSIK